MWNKEIDKNFFLFNEYFYNDYNTLEKEKSFSESVNLFQFDDEKNSINISDINDKKEIKESNNKKIYFYQKKEKSLEENH